MENKMTTNQSAGELLLCPCGKPSNLLNKKRLSGAPYYSVECSVCQITTRFMDTPEEAVTVWNKRTSPQPTDIEQTAKDISNTLTKIITDKDRADALEALETAMQLIRWANAEDTSFLHAHDHLCKALVELETIRASLTQKDASVLVEALEKIAHDDASTWINCSSRDVAKQSLQAWGK